MKLINIGAGLLLCALAACANQSDPTTAVTGVGAALAAAETAADIYVASGKADASVLKQLDTYLSAAEGVINPLMAQAAAGTLPSSVDLTAAEAALNTLTAYEQAQGITKVN
jgi:hypothetical protein